MINIEETTILKLQDAYEKKQVTCREVVLFYLDRIAKIDKTEGGLNSVIEKSWAKLIHKVYNVDPLKCSQCGKCVFSDG